MDNYPFITVEIDGKEVPFSKESVISIIKEHFGAFLTPREGVLFEVDPSKINRLIFEEKRENEEEERLRKRILYALDCLDTNPEKYGRKFYTLIPKKNWYAKTAYELDDLAEELGDHIADYVEQCLEWAQRLTNGETWERLCILPDTLPNYRQLDSIATIGGSLNDQHDIMKWGKLPPTYIGTFSSDKVRENGTWKLRFTVPLVVVYE